MSVFTRSTKGNLSSSTSKENLVLNSVKIKIDSKGRISIPSFLRKNLNLKEGESVDLFFDLKKEFLILKKAEGGSL